MSIMMAALLFFGITVGLILMPFMPCLIEWRRRTDSKPLRVVKESEVDIRHFARGFRNYMKTRLKNALDACVETGSPVEGVLDDNTPYLVVQNDEVPILSKVEKMTHLAEKMVLSCENLNLPAEILFPVEIYARKSVQGGKKNIYRAILVEDSIRLGRESICLRWLHADGVVNVSQGSILYGRVSADKSIQLLEDCWFERLNAPIIEFGHAAKKDETGQKVNHRTILDPKALPNVVEVAAGRWLIDKKLEVPGQHVVDSNLVVAGWGRIREGTRVAGSIKTHKDLYLDKSVEVEGSVISGKDLYIGEGCRIAGPVLSEGNIYIESGTVIGSSEIPTTVGAKDIIVATGTVAYGTFWAHRDGWVCSMNEITRYKKG
jgi:hypothetical protein